MTISTHKIDFAFDGSQIQTCGEVGVDFHRASYISTRVVGGLLDKVLYWGRLYPEVKRLTLPYTIFDGKGTPPHFVYFYWQMVVPFTYLVFFFWTFSQPGFLPASSKFSNTHSLCRDYPAFTLSSMRKSSISAHFVKEVYKRVLCCFFLGQWWILTHLVRGVFRNIGKSKSSTSHASHARKNERGLQIVFLYVTKKAFSYFLPRF